MCAKFSVPTSPSVILPKLLIKLLTLSAAKWEINPFSVFPSYCSSGSFNHVLTEVRGVFRSVLNPSAQPMISSSPTGFPTHLIRTNYVECKSSQIQCLAGLFQAFERGLSVNVASGLFFFFFFSPLRRNIGVEERLSLLD